MHRGPNVSGPNVSGPNLPEPINSGIWGPALWTILHSAAERIGTKHNVRLPQEESRIWMGLLRNLQFTLPCPVCKKHYIKYSSTHKIPVFSKEAIRTWLYELHTQVNRGNNKENTVTLEQIPELYGVPFHFTKHYSVVSTHMKLALQHGWSKREDVAQTCRFFEEMLRFYDFF